MIDRSYFRRFKSSTRLHSITRRVADIKSNVIRTPYFFRVNKNKQPTWDQPALNNHTRVSLGHADSIQPLQRRIFAGISHFGCNVDRECCCLISWWVVCVEGTGWADNRDVSCVLASTERVNTQNNHFQQRKFRFSYTLRKVNQHITWNFLRFWRPIGSFENKWLNLVDGEMQ